MCTAPARSGGENDEKQSEYDDEYCGWEEEDEEEDAVAEKEGNGDDAEGVEAEAAEGELEERFASMGVRKEGSSGRLKLCAKEDTTSTRRTMFGWSSSRRILTSRIAVIEKPWPFSFRIFFSAYLRAPT